MGKIEKLKKEPATRKVSAGKEMNKKSKKFWEETFRKIKRVEPPYLLVFATLFFLMWGVLILMVLAIDDFLEQKCVLRATIELFVGILLFFLFYKIFLWMRKKDKQAGEELTYWGFFDK